MLALYVSEIEFTYIEYVHQQYHYVYKKLYNHLSKLITYISSCYINEI